MPRCSCSATLAVKHCADRTENASSTRVDGVDEAILLQYRCVSTETGCISALTLIGVVLLAIFVRQTARHPRTSDAGASYLTCRV